MTTRQLLVLLGLGALWGGSFLFIKVLVDANIEPLGVSASRTGLGFLTIAPFAWAARARFPRDRRSWLLLAGLGFLNFALPWTLFGIAAQHAPSGASSIANSSQPLWSAIFGTILLKADRLNGIRLLGLFVGFAGVILLMGGDMLNAGSSGSTAVLVMLGATMCYGISAVSIRRFLSHVPAVALAIGQIGFATLYLWPAALVTGAFATAHLGAGQWASLFALGCAGSGIGVIAYMWLIGEVGPVRAAVVTYLMPPLGVFLGWLVLGEPVGWNLLGGLACVVVGVALVQGLPIRRWVLRSASRGPAAVASPID